MAIGLGLALATLALFVWYQRPTARGARRMERLEDAWLRRAQLPPHLTQESLNRRVARLRERHPGRQPAWYIRQVLADLERDRR
jgi:hypothetical protein